MKPTTLQEFRDQQIARVISEVIPADVLTNLPTPEEEFHDLVEIMIPGDELWHCRSAIFQPKQLIGDEGLAVVRAGKPIKYHVVRHY